MLWAEVLMIRLILADDHAVVRAGIRSVLAREPDLAVLAEADDGWRALAAVEAHPEADVLVLDLGMPRLGGMEVLRRIQTRGSRLAVLVLSGYSEDQVGAALQAQGAAGFLCKDRAIEDLTIAVRAVARGCGFFSRPLRRASDVPRGLSPQEILSPRELQVFLLLLEGRSVTVIASELGVTISTVSTYVGHIKDKLGVESVAGIVRYACAAGLVEARRPGALDLPAHHP